MNTRTWTFDPTHSTVGFTVRHMVFAKVRGRFATWSGNLEMSSDDPTSLRVQVEIDAASIDTGVPDRDAHLRSPDFFDAERHPSLRFVSKRVQPVGGDRYEIHGELTIRDTTRSVVLDAHYGGSAKDPWGNQRLAFTASTTIDRKEFGLSWNQVLEAGGVLVGDKVAIEIDVQAIAAAGAKVA